MSTSTLAAGIAGFLLGGLTVSVAAELEKGDEAPPPAHGTSRVHQSAGDPPASGRPTA